MIANNPRYDNIKFVRFQNIYESSLVWNVNATTQQTAFQALQLDSNWVPPQSSNPVSEAVFNEYERKMLTKVTWKATNIRVFLATQLYQPAISQTTPTVIEAPAQQSFDVSQKHNWRIWRFNCPWHGSPILAATKEERAIPLSVGQPRSKMYGAMHLGKSRQMNWFTGSYATLQSTYPDLHDYLKHYMRTGLRGDVSGIIPPVTPQDQFYPTLEIQIMPDDPYPASTVTNIQLLKATLSIEMDITIYSTWLCSKMTQS